MEGCSRVPPHTHARTHGSDGDGTGRLDRAEMRFQRSGWTAEVLAEGKETPNGGLRAPRRLLAWGGLQTL